MIKHTIGQICYHTTNITTYTTVINKKNPKQIISSAHHWVTNKVALESLFQQCLRAAPNFVRYL